ncbi:FG-GAP-like repeat-containing protein [Coralloluteibacterium stylophorae]|uniref:VCBS repeat-containing protein n=1 Tax=Coralloluteibacterium stylophorae TaxID=1776034 RepID=A0AAP2C9M4_9GAMM|nr:FG-GAP-like repeat-containing protein [Coralloluteibacterium stylophorae]MBS7455572.1 VCBS repeat-containing protein [Coralloluteibacterium stylophorae]
MKKVVALAVAGMAGAAWFAHGGSASGPEPTAAGPASQPSGTVERVQGRSTSASLMPVAPSRLDAAGTGIATGPDRGDLVRYAGPTREEGPVTLHPVAVSEAHAIAATVGGILHFITPDGQQLAIRYDRRSESADGNWSWIGHVESMDPRRKAVFTFGPTAVFGSIPRPDGSTLKLTTRAGATYVAVIDSARFDTPAWGDDAVEASGFAAQAADALALRTAEQAVAAATVAATAAEAKTLDLVAGYSKSLADGLGGSAAGATRLSFLVEMANQVLENTGVDGRIRLVKAIQVNYADDHAVDRSFDDLTSGTHSSLRPIRDARETYGGDLVSLVVKFTANSGICGLGNWRTTNGELSGGAYSTVADGWVWDSNGWGTGCSDDTLAHEIGHNLGLNHNADEGGIYPYANGYESVAGNFHDVMNYGLEGTDSVLMFTNPLLKCGAMNLPCGNAATADAARALARTIPIAAAFRSTKVAIGGLQTVSGRVNEQNKDDLVFADNDAATLHAWLMVGTDRRARLAGESVNGSWRLVGSGDLDGDGRVDLLWQSASGELFAGRTRGGIAGIGYAGLGKAGSWEGWHVGGVGDVDGDGKDDILFVNPLRKRYMTWLMDGTRIRRKNASVAYNAAYTLVAHGDFNGDGKLDVLWQRPNTTLRIWLGDGRTLSARNGELGEKPASGYTVAGAGDVTGDGKDDILVVNASRNRAAFWTVSGMKVTRRNASVATLPGASLLTTGDLSGDRKLDLVWKTPAGDVWAWLGDGRVLNARTRKIGSIHDLD